jgi:hypothetical protein
MRFVFMLSPGACQKKPFDGLWQVAPSGRSAPRFGAGAIDE